MENKKNNIFLALLLSLITALAGGVLFGLIYHFGYYIYFLAVIEIVLTCTVFFKFKKGENAGIITLAIIWSVVWTFIFNFLSIIISEAILIAQEYGLSFIQGYTVLVELWKTEPEVSSYMNVRMIQIIAMIIFGGVVYGISYLVNYSRAKKYKKNIENFPQNTNSGNTENYQPSTYTPYQPTTTQTTPKQTINAEELRETYFRIFEDCKKAFNTYLEDKNKNAFKEKLSYIKNSYLNKLSEEENNIIKSNLEKKLSNQATTENDKKVAKLLLSLFIKSE